MKLNKEQKQIIARIAATVLLGGAAWILEKAIPVAFPFTLIMYLVPYLIIGFDILLRALKGILRGQIFDENFLMSIASVGALILGEYPEALFVLLFYQIGEAFQDYAVDKSRNSISELMDICADKAYVERDGAVVEISPEELCIGDIFIVRAGEKIPTDGIIVNGSTSVDTSKITGESVPYSARVGDEIKSGCINISGTVRVKASKLFENSTAAKITQLVESMSGKKARAEGFITRFARYYTPIVVGLAVLVAVLPPLLLDGEWGKWAERALIFLVVSCPCALVISVPMTFFGGIGCGSKNGILIKGSGFIEKLASCDTVVFDKTGTLTRGCFKVTAIHPRDISEKELLRLAATAECFSNHPISSSLRIAHRGEIDSSLISDIAETAGQGISATIEGKRISVGNEKLMTSIDAKWRKCHHSGTIVHIAVDGEYAGHIVISDEIKPNAQMAIKALKKAGIKSTVMLTGDRREVSEAVGKQLGIDEVYSELLPQEKAEHIEKLLAEDKGSLAFVGDGINDAPVIMLADVGFAMGALGSDAAIEAADVVLTDDNPEKTAFAIHLSRFTMRIVKQNIVFSLAVKVAIMLLGGLGITGMWTAVFGDVGVCFLAVLNAMRALNYRRNQV